MVGLEDDKKRCKNQANYIDFVLEPLWREVRRLFPELQICSDRLHKNRELFKLRSLGKCEGVPKAYSARSRERRARSTAKPLLSVKDSNNGNGAPDLLHSQSMKLVSPVFSETRNEKRRSPSRPPSPAVPVLTVENVSTGTDGIPQRPRTARGVEERKVPDAEQDVMLSARSEPAR